MLATLSANPTPMSQTITLDVTDSSVPDPSLLTENRFCPGCKKSVVDENGGVVVAFGQSFFHVDCFKCAKCGNQVTADTNLLLLSDGSPICANCSYCCNVCKQPILDEAIMTGDDSYHAHCFKCKVCKNRIDELVFAKTSQGIYCMNCHNQRVARSRRHAQRQREKEEERKREREKAAAALPPVKAKGDSGTKPSERSPLTSSAGSSAQHESSSESSNRSEQPGSSIQSSRRPSLSSDTTPPSRSVNGQQDDPLRNAARMDSLTVPTMGGGFDRTLNARKSFDGAARSQLQLRPSPSAYSLNTAGTGSSTSNGLSIPNGETSRRDKRRSINPATVQSFSNGTAFPSANSRSSNTPTRESPREYFNEKPESMHSRIRTSSLRPSTPTSLHAGEHDPHQVGRARSGSSTAYVSHRLQEEQIRPPSRPGSAAGRLPSRPSSRNQSPQRLATPTQSESSADQDSRGGLWRNGESRRPPSLKLPPTIRPQKSFDDRAHASPPSSARPLRNSRSSLNAPSIELEHSHPPGTPTPMSPSHRVDVPRGIESETDTEAESDDTKPKPVIQRDLPPAVPPKEQAPSKPNTRPPLLWLDTADASTSDAGRPDSEEGVTDSPESSPVERMSFPTFITPALPPIRISMGGTDFSELLKSVGGDVTKLPQVAETGEDGSLMLDLTTPASGRDSRRHSMQILTPKSDITFKASLESQTDQTPVKRPPRYAQQGLSVGIDGTMASSTSFASSIADELIDKFPSVPRAASMSLEAEVSHLPDDESQDISLPNIYSPVSPSMPKNDVPDMFRLTGRSSLEETQITVTSPPDETLVDFSDTDRQVLQEKLAAASEQSSTQITLDVDIVQKLLKALERQKDEFNDLKRRFDNQKRASQHYMNSLKVTGTEYDRELKARRDAEAEATRLRVLLQGQAVRMSAISGETKRQEAQKQLSEELSNDLSTLGRSLSKLKVERDMTLAEVEQLSASKSSATPVNGEDGAASLTRALSTRFDNIKNQYQTDLLPLQEEREVLQRELVELKASRDAFLEETTMLNARNEELAQLNSHYMRRLEAAGIDLPFASQDSSGHERSDSGFDKSRLIQNLSSSVTSSTVALTEESAESKFIKVSKVEVDTPITHIKAPKFKWPGHKTTKDNAHTAWSDASKQPGRKEHVFQQISVLRVARCDHCGDKMWGSQFRCTNCNIAVHTRCIHHVHLPCSPQTTAADDAAAMQPVPLPPSMFGRDLIEQVRADSRDEPRLIPVIVEKCIDAVDALALDYEGIYRKTGGSSQSKMITQLFERGDYHTFDLKDSERFSDICSVTSVLKNYFRGLPNPLLTHELHGKFMAGAAMKDLSARHEVLTEVVNELPKEHYFTTRALMLHLHRVSQQSDRNLMHAQNLGVVFGPTLMRSPDSSNTFADMAGTATSVQWLVENAPTIFEHPPSFD